MSDWIKVLIGVLAGLVAGLIAEPLKQSLMIYIQSRLIRKVLFLDLSEIYLSFCKPRKNGEGWDLENFHEALTFLPSDKFQYYYDHNRDACYRVKQWRWIHDFYITYDKVRKEALDGKISGQETIKQIRKAFLECARYPEPNHSLLTEVEIHFEKNGIRRLTTKEIGITQ